MIDIESLHFLRSYRAASNARMGIESLFLAREEEEEEGRGSNDEPADCEMFLINHSYSITRGRARRL